MRHARKIVAALLLTLLGFAAARGATIVLANGEFCLPVAEELNARLAGGRVSHFCSEGAALVGDMTLLENRALVTRVTYDPDNPSDILSDSLVELRIRGMTLEDGARCLDAGRGATLALGGQRANYSCNTDQVILGFPQLSEGELSATRASVVQDAEGLYLENPTSVALLELNASSPIVGDEWTLTAFNDDPASVLSERPATLLIEEGRAGGTTGCNSYFAPVTIGEGNEVRFGSGGSTMMFCEGAMEQERRYLDTLEGVTSFEFRNDGSLLLSGPNGNLTFRR